MIFFAKCVKRICVKLRNKHAAMIFLWILCSIVHDPLLSLEGIKLQQISSLKYHGPVECAVKLFSKFSLPASGLSCTEV